MICYDPEQTARSFARHSEADGETVLGIQNRVLERMVEMNELAFFSPHPDVGKFEEILKVCSYVLGRSIDELSSMTAYELLELTFESDKARQSVLCPVALHLQGAPLARGQGAFAVALSLFYTTAIGIGGNEALVEAMTRCFLDHGGTIYTSCPVERIEIDDGRARAVILSEDAVYPGARIEAHNAVISNVGARKTLELVGERTMDAFDSRLATKMKYWKMDERGSTVTSWLIDGEMPWGSADWDPMVKRAHLMYRAYDSWQGAKDYVMAMINNDTWGAFGNMIEILDYGQCDPQRGLAGGLPGHSRRGGDPLSAAARGRARGLGRPDPRRDAAAPSRRDGVDRAGVQGPGPRGLPVDAG